jgi:hypothetical protein
LFLPEIAPDRIQQNAQAARGTAAGEKNATAIFEGGEHGGRDAVRAPRFHELAEFFQHVFVGFK